MALVKAYFLIAAMLMLVQLTFALPSGASTIQLVGKYWTLAVQSSVAGSEVYIMGADPHNDMQVWWIIPADVSEVYIQSKVSGLYLSPAGHNPTPENNQPLIQSNRAHAWYLDPVGDNYYIREPRLGSKNELLYVTSSFPVTLRNASESKSVWVFDTRIPPSSCL
ncbi:MAG: hypothetical protein J3R72DRAFT_465900 [Linnemannia gamsii]|nr:MAG: hypothetical protein J3R72DRAFT_465900 [Linnemannia gamsii]